MLFDRAQGAEALQRWSQPVGRDGAMAAAAAGAAGRRGQLSARAQRRLDQRMSVGDSLTRAEHRAALRVAEAERQPRRRTIIDARAQEEFLERMDAHAQQRDAACAACGCPVPLGYVLLRPLPSCGTKRRLATPHTCRMSGGLLAAS
jgi:hypothetical protein